MEVKNKMSNVNIEFVIKENKYKELTLPLYVTYKNSDSSLYQIIQHVDKDDNIKYYILNCLTGNVVNTHGYNNIDELLEKHSEFEIVDVDIVVKRR